MKNNCAQRTTQEAGYGTQTFNRFCTFEQKRFRPHQGPLSLMEDDGLPLLVLWVCQRSSKVDWPTLYFKAQSRRPLLKCAEILALVVGCGNCQGFKGVEKTRFAGSLTVHCGGQLRLRPLQGSPGGEECSQLMCATTRKPG